MRFRPYPGTRKELDLLTAIAPVFRLDLQREEVELIGTGFWVTNVGHLVTAWHVVEENVGRDGVDRGPIFAVQTFPDRSIVVRNFTKTDKHPVFDLALSETLVAPPFESRNTSPIVMSLDELNINDPVFSFSVMADNHSFEEERLPGLTVARFFGQAIFDQFSMSTQVRFSVRLSFGYVSEIFETMRDSVMLPFPCIQTDVPIYGGNSGGPLFDIRGRIRAVNCTSFGGNDIAFHIPMQGVLDLRMRAESLGMEGLGRRQRSILELAVEQKVSFEPPILDAERIRSSIMCWLRYVTKCLLRRERPSMDLHFATTQSSVKRMDHSGKS